MHILFATLKVKNMIYIVMLDNVIRKIKSKYPMGLGFDIYLY